MIQWIMTSSSSAADPADSPPPCISSGLLRILHTRILILEKEHYPRLKLCAGGLALDAEVILERLGLDVNEVPHVICDNIHFDFEGKGLNIRMPQTTRLARHPPR